MKKTKIFLLAAGALLLVGCGNQTVKNQNQTQKETKNQTQTQEQERKQEKGVITSMEEAMNSGKVMRCTYKMAKQPDDLEAVTYIKGNKVLTEVTVTGPDGKQYKMKSLFDGNESFYSWGGYPAMGNSSNMGTKLTKKCMEELDKSVSSNKGDVQSPDDFKNAVDVKCVQSEADFNVPSNINFTDTCDMMSGADLKRLQNMAGSNK